MELGLLSDNQKLKLKNKVIKILDLIGFEDPEKVYFHFYYDGEDGNLEKLFKILYKGEKIKKQNGRKI